MLVPNALLPLCPVASLRLCSKRSRSGSSMRSNRPSCMAYDEQVRFESTVKIHSKLFNRSREVQ